VFENRVQRKMFGPKKEEVRRHRREVYNEQLHDLYSLPNIIWVIKSRIQKLKVPNWKTLVQDRRR
jgi:hypothetical protein